MEEELKDQVVRLGQFEIGEDQTLSGRKFTDCLILGPMVVVLVGCKLERCTFEHPGDEITSILWRFPKAPQIAGCLALSECEFVQCRFRGVGIAGTPESLDDWKKKLSAL